MKIPLTWSLREVPLVTRGLYAQGGAARRVARLVLERSPEGLCVVAGEDCLILLGPSDLLPWADGVVYLGQEPDAPGLWMPTTCVCDLHPVLVRQMLEPKHGLPLLCLPAQGLFVSLFAQAPLSLSRLGAWLAGRRHE